MSARPRRAPRMLRQLELPQCILSHQLLVVWVRLQDRHELRSDEAEADGALPAARASRMNMAHAEEEAQVSDRLPGPDVLVQHREAVVVLHQLVYSPGDHEEHLVGNHVRLVQELVRGEVHLSQEPLDVCLQLGTAGAEQRDVVKALARHGGGHLEPQGVRDRVEDVRRLVEGRADGRSLEVPPDLQLEVRRDVEALQVALHRSDLLPHLHQLFVSLEDAG
mmetsp:Transcript_10643/g.35656  ORF Transcript_10643/g.35656 Transcript_10643/m.35656 type:complete len:221 (-) Transcript_10643:6714-7376(-)